MIFAAAISQEAVGYVKILRKYTQGQNNVVAHIRNIVDLMLLCTMPIKGVHSPQRQKIKSDYNLKHMTRVFAIISLYTDSNVL